MSSRREQGVAFVRRMYRPRMIGLALGGVAIAGVLIYNGAGLAMWGALLASTILWPHVGLWLGSRSANPYRTELVSLMIDSALGGAWIALMQFNLLPSVVILIMLTMDKMAIGGARFLARCTGALVLACAAGLAWNAAGIPLPATVATILQLLAAAALPLGLVAAGAGLEFVRGTLPLRAIVWWNAIKLGALPAIAYALATPFGLSAFERQIAVLFAAVPTATSAYVLAMQMGGAGAPVALLISTGTLIAIVTVPLWLALVS